MKLKHHRKTNSALCLLLVTSLLWPSLVQADQSALSPAAVGWGNILVPGLGATLRGDTAGGLIEATEEIGLFYGGTFGLKEGAVSIDGSVTVNHDRGLNSALIGQTAQEFGLKLHMYNSFHNYQLAALSIADSEREHENPQPLYKGTLGDILTAPFRSKNLERSWVLWTILGGGAYLLYDYANSSVTRQSYQATAGEVNFYAASQIGIIPFGGAMGEEALFRGFMQREFLGQTHSLWGSILAQTLIFTAIHPNELRIGAFASGLAYGYMAYHYRGDIEPSIAAHFWINVIGGLTDFWTFQRAQAKATPFNPPIVSMSFSY